jgi:hypothetical protein
VRCSAESEDAFRVYSSRRVSTPEVVYGYRVRIDATPGPSACSTHLPCENVQGVATRLKFRTTGESRAAQFTGLSCTMGVNTRWEPRASRLFKRSGVRTICRRRDLIDLQR